MFGFKIRTWVELTVISITVSLVMLHFISEIIHFYIK
jgi:hypothetical protein